jgi:hypothetical protein
MRHPRIVQPLELPHSWSQAMAEPVPVPGLVQPWLLERASAEAEPVSVV